MPKNRQFQVHLPGLLVLASLLISIGYFLLWPPDRQARTLFFPGTTETRLSGEKRLVPRVTDERRALYLVVEELILGPADIRHGRLLPRDTTIDLLAVDGDTAYVDLSPEILFGEAEVRVDLETSLEGVRETLMYNFRWLDAVELTVGGQVPYSPAFVTPEDATG